MLAQVKSLLLKVDRNGDIEREEWKQLLDCYLLGVITKMAYHHRQHLDLGNQTLGQLHPTL